MSSSEMTRRKVMAIGLDGLDLTLAERLIVEGQMPALASLRKRSARFLLDPGPAEETGLAWEHFASGLSPEDARRWSDVMFDPASYTVWQEGAHFAPWWAETDLRVLVFDTPFVDLRRAQNTKGIVGWGLHCDGSARISRPATLQGEFEQAFGKYPGAGWIYGTPWPSAERTRRMGEALCDALDVRGRGARWLAKERCPDWDFFFAIGVELHGGVEGLWHGMDPSHPLNTHPSAGVAAGALLDVHRAFDRMLGHLVDVAGEAAIVAFNMGGMGPNHSDTQSMALLPELLYRHAFGKSLLAVPPVWTAAPERVPILDENDNWHAASSKWVPLPEARETKPSPDGRLRAIARRVLVPLKGLFTDAPSPAFNVGSRPVAPERQELDWQPCARYRDHWPQMPAFALPSFYSGRIRINLRGREKHGIVDLSQYEETCRALKTLLSECRDPRTGKPAVASVERASTTKPLELSSSESDLLVIWSDVTAAALDHPRLGLIGPVPLLRTGGHTRNGMAYLAVPGLDPGERDGVRSSFDVVPTIVQLLGAKPSIQLTGKSLLPATV